MVYDKIDELLILRMGKPREVRIPWANEFLRGCECPVIRLRLSFETNILLTAVRIILCSTSDRLFLCYTDDCLTDIVSIHAADCPITQFDRVIMILLTMIQVVEASHLLLKW